MEKQSLDERLDCIKDAFQTLDERMVQIQAEIERLEQTEMYYAGEWWKDGKYLYHVHPENGDGQRKRVYIGCKDNAVKEARSKVRRWRRHRDLSQALEDLQRKLREWDAEIGWLAERLSMRVNADW